MMPSSAVASPANGMRERDGNAELAGEIRRRERAEAEERRVTERDLAGEADQNIEPKGGDAIDGDLNDQCEPIGRRRTSRRQSAAAADTAPKQPEQHRVARPARRKNRAVGRVSGSEIARRAHGASHVYTRSMVLVPNRPYGLINRIISIA